jgi:hypothetical protein
MNEEILKLADLSGVKVGDTIWTISDGEIEVTNVKLEDFFPIRTGKVTYTTYTLDGKYQHYDKYPSAFIRNPFENIGFQERWMMVSDNEETWKRRKVFMKKNGKFIAWNGSEINQHVEEVFSTCDWKYAKEIEGPKDIELTLEQIAEKFGVSVESIKIKK